MNFPFLFLCAINCLTGIIFNMMTPLLPRFALSLGMSTTAAGVLASIFSITALMGRPLSGALADRLDRRYMMACGIGLMGLSTLGMTWNHNMVLLMFLRMVQGVGFCLNGTVSISAAVGFMPKNREAEGIGYFSLLTIITSSVGPTVALSLEKQMGGPAAVFLVIGGLAMATTLLIWAVKLESEQKEPSAAKRGLSIRDLFAIELLPFALFAGAFSFANGMVSNYLSLAAEAKGIEGYTSYFLINSVTLILIRAFLGKLSDRKGLVPIALPAYIVAGIAMALIGGAQAAWMIYIAAVFKALGQGLGQPAVQGYCVKKMGPSKRGLATSMYYLGSDVFQGIAPIAGGAIVDASGGNYADAFYLVAAVIAVAFIAFAVFAFTGKRRKDPLMITR